MRFRWTVFCTFLCSGLVAVLWGSNIGALYPVIQVAFQGRSLQSWVQEEIDEAQERIEDSETKLQSLQQASVVDQRQMANLRAKLATEKRVLAARQRMQPLVERYLPSDPFKTVAVVVGLVLLGTMLKGIFIFLNTICVANLEQRVGFELRRQFFHRALQMDLHAFGHERTSGLLSRFNTDIGFLTSGIKNLFGSAVREPLKMLACLIGASIISWRLLVFSLVMTPLVALIVRTLARSIKRANRRVMEEISQLYSVLTETFNGIQTVQAYTLEHHERQKFHRVSKQCLHKSMRIAFYNGLTKPITETMGIASISMALLAGAYLVLNRETHLLGIKLTDRPLDVPSLLVFYGLLIGTTEPARKLSEIFNSIQAGIAAADRLYPLLDQQPTIESPQDPKTVSRPHRTMTFENVTFGYVAPQDVLHEINLEVPFGETIAVVGPNGCGKTTLLQMLPRFFDPIEGRVCLDGVDLRELRLRELRQRVGLVTQQSVLFDESVYHNILRGRLDASEADVIRAAKRAKAHRFISEKLADGYDTVVGMGGNRLSGGQRQRIALARAILKDPEILILDEATSQIDLESEQLINQALEDFAKGRTVFMITHRLSSMSLADRILVMNAGRVVDFDSHEALMQRCDLYQRLYALQFRQSA